MQRTAHKVEQTIIEAFW